MKDTQRTIEVGRAGALRAQRRADAIVAQYVHELSHRGGTHVRVGQSVTGADTGNDAVLATAKSR